LGRRSSELFRGDRPVLILIRLFQHLLDEARGLLRNLVFGDFTIFVLVQPLQHHAWAVRRPGTRRLVGQRHAADQHSRHAC
jgi:hypothetical protein